MMLRGTTNAVLEKACEGLFAKYECMKISTFLTVYETERMKPDDLQAKSLCKGMTLQRIYDILKPE